MASSTCHDVASDTHFPPSSIENALCLRRPLSRYATCILFIYCNIYLDLQYRGDYCLLSQYILTTVDVSKSSPELRFGPEPDQTGPYLPAQVR